MQCDDAILGSPREAESKELFCGACRGLSPAGRRRQRRTAWITAGPGWEWLLSLTIVAVLVHPPVGGLNKPSVAHEA